MADDPGISIPVTDADILARVREELARNHELQQRALEGRAVPESVRQGCDVTLSHLGLTRLPAEMIDIIKNEVSRLALDHNRLPGLSGLSQRFSECSRLRYLVMRNNQLREFPTPILTIPTLELLDLRGNKIESLPENLSRMRNLRVFSIHGNRIAKAPLCVGHMNSLVHFNTSKNPITFPPPEEWAVSVRDSAGKAHNQDDDRIRTETKNIKTALLKYSNEERSRTQADGDLSEDNVETPRPTRRKATGRFPIKPSMSATDLKGGFALVSPPLIAPMPLKPPPIPSRSYARLPNQPQTATTATRPSLTPLPTLSERNRSNSESQMNTTRTKRMGMITRKPIVQTSLDLDNNRLSHLRGLSHGSALQPGNISYALAATDSSSPTSPVEGDTKRSTFSRRLSSLPEGKRKSHTEDPIVGLASGMLYALDQIHTPIKNLIAVLKDGKKSNLELACQAAFSFAEDLDRLLTKARTHDEEIDEDERHKAALSISMNCQTCIKAFENLVVALRQEVAVLVTFGNPQYIRTLLHMLYASLIEVRNSCSRLGVDFQAAKPSTEAQRDVSRGRYLSPGPGRPLTSLRVRDRTPVTNPNSRSSSRHAQPPVSRPIRAASRTGSFSSVTSGPLGSAAIRPENPFNPFGGPVPTRMSRSNTLMSVDELEEEQQFEQIFLRLSSACDYAVQALPRCHVMVTEAKKQAVDRLSNDIDSSTYEVICDRGKIAIDAADALKKRLGTLTLKEKGIRSQLDFWQLCTAFTRAYFMFAGRVKDCYQGPVSLLPEEIKHLLKPVQRSVKDVSKAINDSPWGYLAATPGQQPVMSATNANIKSFNAAMNNMTTMANNNMAAHPLPHLNNITKPIYQQQQQQQPQLSRSAFYKQPPPLLAGTPLTLTTRGPVAPVTPLDPQSATSNHSASTSFSGGGVFGGAGNPNNVGPIAQTGVISGIMTPMPGTPLSAALGPAAGAILPLPQTIVPTTLPVGLPPVSTVPAGYPSIATMAALGSSAGSAYIPAGSASFPAPTNGGVAVAAYFSGLTNGAMQNGMMMQNGITQGSGGFGHVVGNGAGPTLAPPGGLGTGKMERTRSSSQVRR